MPLLARLTLAVLSGGALCAAFPSQDVWPLAPVGVALLAMATCGARAVQGALLGFVTGVIFYGYSLSWSGIVVGILPWTALAISQAASLALLGLVSAYLQSRGRLIGLPSLARIRFRGPPFPAGPRVRPLVIALAWVVQEAIRDRVPYGGFPWVRLAFSQADSPFGRLAAVLGAPGVTFAVALAGGLLAASGYQLLAHFTSVGRQGSEFTPAAFRIWGLPRLAVVALAVAGAIAVGLVGLLVPLPVDGAEGNVMAVQGNVPRPGLEFNAERRQVLDNHVAATVGAAAEVGSGTRPHPDLVVWPENASDIDPSRNPDAEQQINRAVQAINAPLVAGTLYEQPSPDISNVSVLYLPGQGPSTVYVKQHPVPFAEYIPNRDFFRLFSDRVDLVRYGMAAGAGPVVFRVPTQGGGEIVAGPSICFEVAYDDLVRDNVQLGANLLLVQTNNATFGYSDESVQQLAISRIRAMEHGRSVVHVSTVGVSALITPDGTVHQPSTLFSQAVLSGSLPLREAYTVATVLGPWPEYVACLVLLGLLLAALRPRASGEGETSGTDRTSGTGKARIGVEAGTHVAAP